MTTNLDTPLMPAQHTTSPAPTADRIGEGVKSVALFESRKGRVTRAWDELSEIDRAMLLESVRQRRKVQAQKMKIENEIYNLRRHR